MSPPKRVKSRSCHIPPALSAQDVLILLGIILVAATSLLGAFSSPESLVILVDNAASQDLARMAALAERRATDKLLDMLEWQDDDPPLWYDTADEPPPPPPPFWFNSRPLDVDEEGLPVERPLEVVPNMARALKWSENREIDWEGPGEPAEIDLGLNNNEPPALGLGLIFGAPLAPTAPATVTTNVAPPATMGLEFEFEFLDDNTDAYTDTLSDTGAEYDYDPDTDSDDTDYDTVVSDEYDHIDDVSVDGSPATVEHGFNLGSIFNSALSTLSSYLGDNFVALPANAGPGPEFDDVTATSIPTHGIYVDAHDESTFDEPAWSSLHETSSFAPRQGSPPVEVFNDFDVDYNDAPLAPPPALGRRAHLELPDVDDFLPTPWDG